MASRRTGKWLCHARVHSGREDEPQTGRAGGGGGGGERGGSGRQTERGWRASYIVLVTGTKKPSFPFHIVHIFAPIFSSLVFITHTHALEPRSFCLSSA